MFVTLWEWHLVFIFMDLIVPVGEINKMTLWGSFLSAEQVSFLQQRTQRQLCAEDERAGVSSCPNHPIFTVNTIRPCICIHHRKPGTGSPSILEVKVSVQYLAKACLMCCLFIEHSMCYFHLLLICKNNKTAICCEKHRVHINCSECLVCNSLRNWVCNSEGRNNSLCRPGSPGLHTSTTLVKQEGRTNFTQWCVSLSCNLGIFWFVTPGPLSVLCPRHYSCQERTDYCSSYWAGLHRPLALTALETATGMRTLLELISLMEGSLFSIGVLTDMVQKLNCTWQIDSQL